MYLYEKKGAKHLKFGQQVLEMIDCMLVKSNPCSVNSLMFNGGILHALGIHVYDLNKTWNGRCFKHQTTIYADMGKHTEPFRYH